MRMLRYLTPVLMLSSGAMAADVPKVGAMFRGEINYNNNKTMETTTTKAGSLTSTNQTAFFDATVNGSLGENVKVETQVTFVNGGNSIVEFCANSPVKLANAAWSPNAMFSAKIGCSKDRVGGWDFANYEEAQTIRPYLPMDAYGPNNSMYNPAIDLTLHTFGDLTLRFQNDVGTATTAPGTGEWTSKTQQTWGLEWQGDIAGIKPLIQYASFDSGHSYTTDLGLMLNVAGVGVTFDWMMLAKSHKQPNSAGTKSVSKLDNSNRFSLEVTYAMPSFTPFLYWSNYKNTPYKPASGTADKANSLPGTWDNNGQVISIGASATGISQWYAPYIAFDMPSGTFYNDATKATKKSKSDFVARLGATARF